MWIQSKLQIFCYVLIIFPKSNNIDAMELFENLFIAIEDFTVQTKSLLTNWSLEIYILKKKML